MKKTICYVEPAAYFPRQIRKKYKIGEYAESLPPKRRENDMEQKRLIDRWAEDKNGFSIVKPAPESEHKPMTLEEKWAADGAPLVTPPDEEEK